jgi:uncharacterized protein (TIGR02246 family)
MDAIDELFAAWKDATQRGDVDAIVGLVTEDAEFWTHGMPAVKGRAAVRKLYEQFRSAYSIEQEFEEIERIVAGDYAFIRGVEHNSVTPRGGETVNVVQRAFMIVRRDDDGRWRFARGMTNRESAQ